MKISFKLKLVLSYIAIIMVSFGFIAIFLDKRLEDNSMHNIQATLVTEAHLIGTQIPAEALRKKDTAFLEALVKALSQKAECRITIIDLPGRVLADSWKSEEDISRMENHLNRPEIKAALDGADSIGIDTRYSSTLKINMLYVALPIKDVRQTIGILRLALPLKSVKNTLSIIRKTVFLGLAFSLILALVLGSIVAARTIKPINRMIDVSRRYSNGDFSRRIIRASRDEIGELADTLNKMAQDIEEKIGQIRTQNQKLAATFDGMIEGIIIVDKAAHIITVNPAVERIFGISKEDAQGKFLLEAIRNNDIAEVINGVLKNRESASGEISLILPVRKVFQFNAVPIFENDMVNGCLAVVHDITEIRRLETIRSDFIANVSHELKTPLTSIKGFVETLLDGALDEKETAAAFIKIIQDHTERLNNLVNDLLSLSSLESKDIALEKKKLNLHKLAEEVILGFSSQLKKKKIKIENKLPSSLEIEADENRIEQVLTNLIDNAVKFNKEKGFIKIYNPAPDGSIKIIVEDAGLGIPEKDLPRIFERFYRVDKARSRELGGTGLGLSIVKHIVELHGGGVGVESTEGSGSKFWFTLPG